MRQEHEAALLRDRGPAVRAGDLSALHPRLQSNAESIDLVGPFTSRIGTASEMHGVDTEDGLSELFGASADVCQTILLSDNSGRQSVTKKRLAGFELAQAKLLNGNRDYPEKYIARYMVLSTTIA